MRKIRIGNDIKVSWAVTVNGGELELSSLGGLRLQLTDPAGFASFVDFDIIGGQLVFLWQGIHQHRTGPYSLTLFANYGIEGQAVLDCCDFVTLVARSCAASPPSGGSIEVGEAISLTGNIAVGVQGKSAYQSWLAAGHVGSEQEFIDWIRQPAIEAAANAPQMQLLGDTATVDI